MTCDSHTCYCLPGMHFCDTAISLYIRIKQNVCPQSTPLTSRLTPAYILPSWVYWYFDIPHNASLLWKIPDKVSAATLATSHTETRFGIYSQHIHCNIPVLKKVSYVMRA